MSLPFLRAGTLALGLILVGGCGGGSSAPEATTPDAVVTTISKQVQKDDLAGLVRSILNPAAYAKAQQEWDKKRKEPVKDEDKVQFSMVMTQLTAPGAENTLFLLAKPKLAEAQQMLPMAGMFLGMAVQGVAKEDKLSAEEKQQAQKVAAALSTWITGLKLDDEAKLKQAIGIACTTARALKLENMDQVCALEFDALLTKVGPVVGGVSSILAIYGLDLKAAAASMKAGTPLVTGTTAKVPVSFTLLGQTFSSTSIFEQHGGKWFPQEKATKTSGSDKPAP